MISAQKTLLRYILSDGVILLDLLIKIIEVLDAEMTKPEMYGWFHILWLVITAVCTVLLCRFFKAGTDRQVHNVIFITAVTVIVLEIYKQINYTFTVSDGLIKTDYQWYAFPFQFCSTPMYVGFLAGIVRKGKLHDALCAYLATYAVFAGLGVMFYPETVFISTIGINIQTMICHGSMIAVGAYLLFTGYVKVEHRTILKALPVFAVTVSIAVVLNELAHVTGLLETDTFNMFFVSPYCEPSLPVYSLVQGVVPFPWCLILYIFGFTAAAYIVLLLAIVIKKMVLKHTKAAATV